MCPIHKQDYFKADYFMNLEHLVNLKAKDSGKILQKIAKTK